MPDYDAAVILSACRTPIGSFGGAFKDLSASDLGAVGHSRSRSAGWGRGP
jgi:acetyl-CoA acetyltransferase